MIGLLWIHAAQAAIVNEKVEICVDYDTHYDDVGSEDFWADNTIDRWARGVEIDLVDLSTTRTLFVSHSTGCLEETVKVDDSDYEFSVVVRSRAKVQGVEYEVHPHLNPADWSTHVSEFEEELFVLDASVPAHRITTSSAVAWQVTAAVSWIFHRSRFKIWNGVNRDCCYQGALPDGTCSNSSNFYGAPNKQTLHYFVRTDSGGCGGGNATGRVDNRLDSIELIGNCSRKGLFAHETGHLIVGIRMDGREGEGGYTPNGAPWGAGWDNDADLDGCSGDYWDSLGSDLIDEGESFAKGRLTKEYASNAVREGWADFFSMWAWNSKNGTNCHSEMWVNAYQDLDLDGSVDNHPVQEMDCASTGCWLDDVESATGNGCDRAPVVGGNDLELNRSTVWDVGPMYWHLWQSDGLSTGRLSDLYVDSCPRLWSVNDSEWTTSTADHASRPIERLYDSSAYHSSTTSDVDGALDAFVAH
jgi:hypothetical protein